jgi:hypothetical protein
MKRTFAVVIFALAIAFSGAFAQTDKKPVQKKAVETKTTDSKTTDKKEAPKTTDKKPVEKKATDKKTDKAADKKLGKPLTGTVVSLSEWLIGKSGKLSKADAQKFQDSGSPLVLLVGKGKSAKVYFVFNTDGSFAGKKLVNYAENATVNVYGKKKTTGGMNIVYMEKID